MNKGKLLILSAIISSFLVFIYIGGAQLCVGALRASIETGEAFPLITAIKLIADSFVDLLLIILVVSFFIWFGLVVFFKNSSRNKSSELAKQLAAEQHVDPNA